MEYMVSSKQDGHGLIALDWLDSTLQVSFSLHFLLYILVIGLHPPLSCKNVESFSLLGRVCEMPDQNRTLWQCEGSVFGHR